MPKWNVGDVTLPEISMSARARSGRCLCLTVLYHPDAERIGDVAFLEGLDRNELLELGRLHPMFHPPREPGLVRTLEDPYLSRRPVSLRMESGLLEVSVPEGGSSLSLNGEAVRDSYRVAAGQLQAGVVLLLARRIVLFLHYHKPLTPETDSCDMVGESDPLQLVREMIAKVAATEVPVLLLGESGTGKELAATAIHRRSHRADQALVSLNMAAIPDELAASELFGIRRGAYTGADSDRPGFFQQADGGTLFLDEIGACSPSVQAQLLRALAEGEIQSPGGARARVDVRVLAATDARLDHEAGDFSNALKHRLGGFEIHMPPLRERRDDIGRLLARLLPPGTLAGAANDPVVVAQWAGLVCELARYHWPGNVRELGNYCRQVAIASEGQPRLVVPDNILGTLRSMSHRKAETGKPVRRDATRLDDAQIEAAMEAAEWEMSRAARDLNISRQALYRRVGAIPGLRVAAAVPAAEVQAVHRECGGVLEIAARQLRVSAAGLRRRWRAMDLEEAVD
jgi:two-component system nitrogen regulation response regulator GlnG